MEATNKTIRFGKSNLLLDNGNPYAFALPGNIVQYCPSVRPTIETVSLFSFCCYCTISIFVAIFTMTASNGET
jgi:hypothetical protein